MLKRLVLVGGSAGTGKTTVAQALAADLGAGWLQVDTLWITMRAATERGSPAHDLLDVPGRMARGEESDEAVLAAHVAASEAVCQVLPEVFAFELEARPVMVADGAWLLPSFVAGLALPDTEMSCLFLEQAGVEGVAAALAPRLGGRPPEERHERMNRRIWQYGTWVCDQARAHGLPVVDSLPFATLVDRSRSVLGLDHHPRT